MGPYAYKGRLDVRVNNGWAIDGSVATIGGQNYFFYSSGWATSRDCSSRA
jgi:hypothetical protein